MSGVQSTYNNSSLGQYPLLLPPPKGNPHMKKVSSVGQQLLSGRNRRDVGVAVRKRDSGVDSLQQVEPKPRKEEVLHLGSPPSPIHFHPSFSSPELSEIRFPPSPFLPSFSGGKQASVSIRGSDGEGRERKKRSSSLLSFPSFPSHRPGLAIFLHTLSSSLCNGWYTAATAAIQTLSLPVSALTRRRRAHRNKWNPAFLILLLFFFPVVFFLGGGKAWQHWN